MNSKIIIFLVTLLLLALALLFALPEEAPHARAVPFPLAPSSLAVEGNTELVANEPESLPATETRTVSIRNPQKQVVAPATETFQFLLHARILNENGAAVRDAVLSAENYTSEASSDSDGKLTLTITPSEDDQIDQEEWSLRVSAAGYAPLYLDRQRTGEKETWLGDLKLRAAVRIEGIVVDHLDTPVAGALVVASSETVAANDGWRHRLIRSGPDGIKHGHPALAAARSAPYVAESGSDGRFVIEGFGDSWATLYARKGDTRWALESPVAIDDAPDREPLRLVLPPPTPETWIRGHVEDSKGNRLEGVRMQLTDADGKTESGKTDSSGNYEYWVPAGSIWQIQFHPVIWEQDGLTVQGIAAGTIDTHIVLPESAWFWAHVRDEAGAPLSDGIVQGLVADDYESSGGKIEHQLSRVASDLWADGRARLHLSSVRFYLRAVAPGYSTKIVGPFPAGHRERVEIQLTREPALRGTVSANGAVLVGASFTALRHAKEGSEYWDRSWRHSGEAISMRGSSFTVRQVSTKARGQFVCPYPKSNQAGERFLLRAEFPGYASKSLGPFTLAELGALEELDITLTPGGTVQGELKLTAGQSAAGWTIIAASEQGEIKRRQVGARGVFRFENLQPGDWQLRGIAVNVDFMPWFALRPREKRQSDVRVQEGKTASAIVEILMPEPAILRGTITIARRDPEPWVAGLRDEGGAWRGFSVGSDGEFIVEGLTPGEWTLLLRSENLELGYFKLTDKLHLPSGVTTWNQELTLAEVSAKVEVDGFEFTEKTHGLVRRGPGDLYVASSLRIEADGEITTWLFPVGQLELVEMLYGREVTDSPTFVPQEHELLEGETLTVKAPR